MGLVMLASRCMGDLVSYGVSPHKMPLPFGIVLCDFQSRLSLDRSWAGLSRFSTAFGQVSRGSLEFVNLVDHKTLSLRGPTAGCRTPWSHRNSPSWGLILYPVARPWHKIPKLCYRHCWAGLILLSAPRRVLRNSLGRAHGELINGLYNNPTPRHPEFEPQSLV